MTTSLLDLAAPHHTALVTQELQGAVVGADAGLPALADAARRQALPNIARLVSAARGAGVQVVHCLVHRRPDGRGSNHNARLFAASRDKVRIDPGSPGATLLGEFGPEPTDLVLSRGHGVGPMGGTDLDAVLRNLGVSTIVGEFGPEPTDLVLSRGHGVGPMGGTDLDAVLRNLGVSTIVAVGVSLNVAIPNLVMDAVNAAYRV
uniref:cysteine hydrolase n=1 Tax=Mycolicibacterium hippocampi TaxID=659824 RepID=UPI0021F294DC